MSASRRRLGLGLLGVGVLVAGLVIAGSVVGRGDARQSAIDRRTDRERARLAPAGAVATEATGASRPADADRSRPPVPCDGVDLRPGDDLQAGIDARPPGTTFCLAAGHYREASIRPRDGDRLVGASDAVLSGAREVTGFMPRSGRWTARVALASAPPTGTCAEDAPRCNQPERAFLDGVALWPVTAVAKVVPGTYHLDPPTGTLTIADDPAGRVAELSVVAHGVDGDARGVSLVGFTVERYATPSQHGAIQARPGAQGWTVRGVTARQNAAAGLAASDHVGLTVADSSFVDNGQVGLVASGRDLAIEHNELRHNNVAGFDGTWEAGGAKVTNASGLVARSNRVSANDGPGIWVDLDSRDVLIEANVVDDNADSGIFYEISREATISGNVVLRNGRGIGDRWCYGGGIVVSSSSGVTVAGNTLVDNHRGIIGIQQDRGAGADGFHRLAEFTATGNAVNSSGPPSPSGVCDDHRGEAWTADRAIRFDGNRYAGSSRAWTWSGADVRDFADWQDRGFDGSGTSDALQVAGDIFDDAVRAVADAAGPRSPA